MAGHSKWANIKFRKAAQDAKRGKVFTKLIKEITVAARIGGGDMEANPRLRAGVDKALAANMTRDTIQRAVKRGAGDADGAAIEEIRYEGYAANGVAVLVECATDNHNRSVSEVRHAFAKHGGNLGTAGSVAYLFERIGSLVFAAGVDEERVMEIALAAGADDVDSEDGVVEVVTSPENYLRVAQAFNNNENNNENNTEGTAEIRPEMSELIQRPTTQVALTAEQGESVLKLIDALEQLDDVQDVFTNALFAEAH